MHGLARAASLPTGCAGKPALTQASSGGASPSPDFAQVLLLQSLTQGASLVGKSVVYNVNGSSQPRKGLVSSVAVENGNVSLLVNGNKIALSQVRAIVAS